jgi:hypothetical protein
MQASRGFAVASQRLHAGNASHASASQWHRGVFTLSMQASLRLRRGITASSRWQCKPRFGFAVASQRLHAVNASLALASQWHRSVFTLSMQASLRLRGGIAASSRCRCSLCFGFVVASQRLHAGNAGFALASQWHFSVLKLNAGLALAS